MPARGLLATGEGLGGVVDHVTAAAVLALTAVIAALLLARLFLREKGIALPRPWRLRFDGSCALLIVCYVVVVAARFRLLS